MPYKAGLGSPRQFRLKKSDDLDLIRMATSVDLSLADVARKCFSIGLKALKRNPALLVQDNDVEAPPEKHAA